jgi:hypothetical protein
VDPEKGYWHRQVYLLSSLGLFYIILIALFAIPLVATVVVILIKGALDLRYYIIAGGFVLLVALGVYAVRFVRRLVDRIHQDAIAAGADLRSSRLLDNPVEVSIFNGLLRFSFGQAQPDRQPALVHRGTALLTHRTERGAVTDVLDQLQSLSELKRNGTIDDDEFNMLKALLIESSTASCPAADQDLS